MRKLQSLWFTASPGGTLNEGKLNTFLNNYGNTPRGITCSVLLVRRDINKIPDPLDFFFFFCYIKRGLSLRLVLKSITALIDCP